MLKTKYQRILLYALIAYIITALYINIYMDSYKLTSILIAFFAYYFIIKFAYKKYTKISHLALITCYKCGVSFNLDEKSSVSCTCGETNCVKVKNRILKVTGTGKIIYFNLNLFSVKLKTKNFNSETPITIKL